MNKSDKTIIFFYILLASSYGLFVLISSEGLEGNILELVLPKKISDFETITLVDVEKERLFDVIVDIKRYPIVLPNNVVSVNILNKTNNIIIAEEELSEAGLKTKMVVKHTITPYDKHVIEIIEGDAEGTIIIQDFESIGLQTKLTTNVHLNLQGVTSFVAFLPESNLIHVVNTVINRFVEYAKYDIYEKTVDTFYQEILSRSADREGLMYYSELLRNKKMTEQELRDILLNSEERKLLNMKPVEELNNNTINVINNLYEKILLRKADPEGMRYFGNLLENGVTPDEIRAILLESDEGKNVSPLHPIRSEIITAYRSLLDRFPEDAEVDYYHKMIDEELMTIDDVKKEIILSEEYKNLKIN